MAEGSSVELGVDDGMLARGCFWTLWEVLITSNLEVFETIVAGA